jgi:hypothetical protein
VPEPEDEDEEPEHDLLDELEIEVERPAKKATRAKAAPKPVTRGRRSRRID